MNAHYRPRPWANQYQNPGQSQSLSGGLRLWGVSLYPARAGQRDRSYSAWKILLKEGVTEQQDERYNQRVNGKRLDHGQTDDHGGQDSTAGLGIP